MKQSNETPPVPDRRPGRWPYYLGAGMLAAAGVGLAYFARKARRGEPA